MLVLALIAFDDDSSVCVCLSVYVSVCVLVSSSLVAWVMDCWSRGTQFSSQLLLLFPWARSFTHIDPVDQSYQWGPGISQGSKCQLAMSPLMVEVPVGLQVTTPSSMRYGQSSCWTVHIEEPVNCLCMWSLINPIGLDKQTTDWKSPDD